jgi:hypothetical protein
MTPSSFRGAQEIYVPCLENGSIHYLAREAIFASDNRSTWIIKDAHRHPLSAITKRASVKFVATDNDPDNRHPPDSAF